MFLITHLSVLTFLTLLVSVIYINMFMVVCRNFFDYKQSSGSTFMQVYLINKKPSHSDIH